MPNIVYTDAFFTDMLMVESSRIEAAIFDAIDLLPYMPILGAKTSHTSIVSAYGEGVRVISVTPFDVVYRILPEGGSLFWASFSVDRFIECSFRSAPPRPRRHRPPKMLL